MKALLALILVALTVCSFSLAGIDPKDVTLTGFSSGAFFAVQFHMAHSSWVKGAAVLAGGPLYCARGSMTSALTECMRVPILLPVEILVSKAREFEAANEIDPLSNVANQKLMVISGQKDTTVVPGVVHKLVDYYSQIGVKINDNKVFKSNFDKIAEHTFMTQSYGNPCTLNGTPYIGNCNYNLAGDILNFMYEDLKEGVAKNDSNLISFDQTRFIPDRSKTFFADNGYMYIPSGCRSLVMNGKDSNSSSCRLHVVFHGCVQNVGTVGEVFVRNIGFNEIAEANNIIILYPQTTKGGFTTNPNACYDWWGFTGSKYYSKEGLQMVAVKRMIDSLVQGTFAEALKM